MSIKIKIPEFLRQKTGGESSIDVVGGTVRECIETLVRRYPSLKGEIVDAQGVLLLKWVILVNGEVANTSTEELLHPVKGGDVVVLIPMIAGG